MSASEIELDGVVLTDVGIRNRGDGWLIEVNQVKLDSQSDLLLEKLQLECAETGSAEAGFCPGGNWRLKLNSKQDNWNETVVGTSSGLTMSQMGWALESSVLVGKFVAVADIVEQEDGTAVNLSWKQQGIESLPFTALWPEPMNWVKSGTSQGRLVVQIPAQTENQQGNQEPESLSVQFELSVEGVSLDSPEGLYAAEGLALKTKGIWKLPENGTAGNGQVDIQTSFLSGEVLLDRFYTSFGPSPLLLDMRIGLAEESINISKILIEDENALNVLASARFSLEDPLNSLQYQVMQLDMKFPAAYQKYLEPVLASWTLDQLVVTGGLSWSGSGEGNEYPSGTLVLDDLSVVDNVQNRFAFTGMKAHIEAGKSQGESDFTWQGMLLGKINLGAGQAGLKTAPGLFELASPLKLEMLGGEFVVDGFRLKLPPAGSPDLEPDVEFQAALNNMDMEQLTRALDWPAFGGKISGRIPGASFDDGVLTVDGLLSFEAFDGEIQLSDLRVERLFGVLPSMAANLEVKNLDLQLLTHAFSFGQIAGRMDGYIQDLRMLDWSPVSFDAWFGTPESQSKSRQISRQAVNHLTSIGGGGATAALTGPLMRMFNNFSYSRLGMGCKLENYVCTIRGLNDEIDSVLIMEGSGIPKLSIQVFNRRMNWPQLVSNLSAASSGESIRIGDP